MKTLAVIDFETTGLDFVKDQVIEGAVVLVSVKNAQIDSKLDEYASFNDPQCEISPFVSKLTGITQEMVYGQKLDWNRFNEVCERADLLVAHNARFDRGIFEAKGGVSSKPWACSVDMIDWKGTHFLPCRHLKHLAWEHGIHPNAHRALDDVNTLVEILKLKGNETDRTYSEELLENAGKKSYLIKAHNSPFESKDLLKKRRFRWSPQHRFWWKIVSEDERKELDTFLCNEIYLGPNQASMDEVDKLDPHLFQKQGLA